MTISTANLATRFGANVTPAGAEFRVWAPNARRLTLRLQRQGESEFREIAMQPEAGGNFSLSAQAATGDRYFYRVNDSQPVPDPVSRLLPEGVHGPTEIVDPAAFQWSDQSWRGLP